MPAAKPKEFVNSEERLAVEVPRALEERARAGLEGLVGRLLVHEYIYRYGTFSGFFTKSNVTALTRATDNQ